jgi:Protein of unknown function (DUF4058)
MPIHDWTRVEGGVFHHFHHGWIEEIARTLNRGVLPDDYYAMAEQHAAGFGPDVLTLQGAETDDNEGDEGPPRVSRGSLLLAAPKLQPIAETDMDFYRRKQNAISVRHVSGDHIVAMVEIVSPGNKAARNPLHAFVQKAADLLGKQIHLLILDLLPPGRRDPQGIHGVIWDDISGQEYTAPPDKPITLAAYESDLAIRAYVVHAAVGDTLIEMPLFLKPGLCVSVPLEATYQSAWAAVPRRWQRVLAAPSD